MVKGAEGKEGAVDVVVPTDEKDINAAYEDACHVLASKAPPQVEKVDLEVKMTDSYRAIRTNVSSPSSSSFTLRLGVTS